MVSLRKRWEPGVRIRSRTVQSMAKGAMEAITGNQLSTGFLSISRTRKRERRQQGEDSPISLGRHRELGRIVPALVPE